MDSLAFVEYASSPERTPEEIYVIELLIDRVRIKFDDEWYEANRANDTIRGLPSYRPSVPEEDLVKAAAEIVRMTWLSFQRTNEDLPPLRTVEPLRFIRGLRDLFLSGNKVSSLLPLAGLPALTELDIKSNPVTDLSPLCACARLRKLTLDESAEADWAVLKDVPTLSELHISGQCAGQFCRIPILPALRSCDIYCSSDHELESFAGFPEMPELREFSGLHMTGIQGIERYPLLENLTGVTFRVNSFEPLRALKKLTHANIHDTRVESVAPLVELMELRAIWLSSSKEIRNVEALAELPLLHVADIRTGDSDKGRPVDHPRLEDLRRRLRSWDVEFLLAQPRLQPSARIEVVDEEIFQFYNAQEKYGVPLGFANSGWLSSEIEWLDDRIERRLDRYLKDDVDFTLPFQWMGGRSRTVYLMSIRSLRHLARVIEDIQQALAYFRSDWIIYLEAGEIDIEGAEFEAWIYPDKIMATEENAAVLRRFMGSGFRWTWWLYPLRILR